MTKYEDARLPTRFWSKTRLSDTTPNACWLWTGDVDSNGYPKFSSGNDHCLAGRMAYNVLVRLLERSCNLKRTCKNIRCVNPDHGKPSDAATLAMNEANAARRVARSRENFSLELCTACHETVVWNGKAWCDRHDENSWSEHRHQPGALGKAAVMEAAGASAKGRYGKPRVKVVEEEEGDE